MARDLADLRRRVERLNPKAYPEEHARLTRLLAERANGLIYIERLKNGR
jgi:hypothetical protein